jgi:hypothetical protein
MLMDKLPKTHRKRKKEEAKNFAKMENLLQTSPLRADST